MGKFMKLQFGEVNKTSKPICEDQLKKKRRKK